MITVGYLKVDCCDRALDGVRLCSRGSYAHSAVLSNRLRPLARPRPRPSLRPEPLLEPNHYVITSPRKGERGSAHRLDRIPGAGNTD